MLTPAEVLGLSGLSLASRVRNAFLRIPERELIEIAERVQEECRLRRLCYMRDGLEDLIHVMPLPLTVLPEQISYVHYVTVTIQNALKRLPDLYMADFSVRDILRLPPEEEAWLWDCWGPSQRENNPMFARLDALVDFISPMWKDSLKFVEPNLSCIGGLYLVPTANEIVTDVVSPVLGRLDPSVSLEMCRDIRDLLMEELLEHLQAIGRPGGSICFVDPKYVGSGADEQELLAGYLRERHGLNVLHADPAELELRGREVYYEGAVVDLVYRDYLVTDLLALKAAGRDAAMKELFRQNRVVSSIGGDLDQKSCWEVLTDPDIAGRHYNAEERQVFRRHVLWTRVLSNRRTRLPRGDTGDLLEHVRHERETLVLKPNRAFGGQGVQIGLLMTQAEWESAMEEALKGPDRWVVQERASIPASEFPVVGPERTAHLEPFYTVMGFAATRSGVAVFGRASQKQVVNVANRGGMCVVMVGRTPGKLHGPQRLRNGAR
ncbi:MAG: hypothetical protein U0793_19885 [Gemmataceae bacterium]